MKSLIETKLQPGFNPVFSAGEYRMTMTDFAVINLAPGAKYEFNTGEKEVALVLLGGKCAISGDDFNFPEVGGRADVFSGKPHTVYLPRRTRVCIVGADCGVDIAWNAAPVTRRTAQPTLITPEMTRTISIGRDNFTRLATIMIDEKFDSEHFYIGEGMVPGGNWSGYPPHKHDVDNLPHEIRMEETYFYRFKPAHGFGIQKVYSADGAIDEIYTIRENDTVAIKDGYHPLAAAPGYEMYYLWTMAGEVNRGLISAKDPLHDWVK